jgi:hypothetical protein
MRAGVAVLAVAFQLAVRAAGAVHAAAFHLAMRAGAADSAEVFPPAVRAPLYSSHQLAIVRSSPTRAHRVWTRRAAS